MATKEWFQEVGWNTNPFTLTISPSLFVGYKEQVDKIQNHLQELHKVALVTGPTGAGKTTLLKWLSKQLQNCHVKYLSKPPKNPADLITIFTSDEFSPSIWDRILRREPNLYNLSEYVSIRMPDRQFVLLVDEAHEAPIEVLEWLRVLNDHIDNMSLVLAGLPIFEDILKDKLQTFYKRITTKIELTTLTHDETEQLIKRRIGNVGGEGMEPFTPEIIEDIYMKTGGFPREILKACDQVINNAIEKETLELTNLQVEKRKPKKKDRLSMEAIEELPSKQKEVLEALINMGSGSAAKIAETMDHGYKSKGHATRSVNNLLKRLMSEGLVKREKEGRSFVYKPSSSVNTMMVKA